MSRLDSAVVIDDNEELRLGAAQVVQEVTGLDESSVVVLGEDCIVGKVPAPQDVVAEIRGPDTIVISDRDLKDGREGDEIVKQAKEAGARYVALFSGAIESKTRAALEALGITCIQKDNLNNDNSLAKLRRWLNQITDPNQIPTIDSYDSYTDVRRMISVMAVYCYPGGSEGGHAECPSFDAVIPGHPAVMFARMDLAAVRASNALFARFEERNLPPLREPCVLLFRGMHCEGFLRQSEFSNISGWLQSELQKAAKGKG